MSLHKDYLTASDFYRYLQCPHWPYFERFASTEEKGLKREVTEGELRRMENGLVHEREIVQKLFSGQLVREVPRTFNAEQDALETLRLMQEGVPLIYQGTLTDGDWTGRPDVLERQEGVSVFGDWFYVPLDVKSTHALEKYQKLQLVFYATLLERVQKRFPAEPAILNSDGERLPFVAADCISEFQEFVVELERIRSGEKPEAVLRKSCFDTSPWGKACERLARMNNDIALLYNIDVRKLRALRQLGVRTIDEAAAMNPETLDGVLPGLRQHGLEVAKAQAESLKDKLVIVREAVSLPSDGLEIHFDIESDPPSDVDYLYGFLLREPTGDRYLPFVAERLEDEGKMWQAFLDWLPTLPPLYTVYHFAAYEKIRLGVLERRYGGSEHLNLFRERLVDLKEITTSSIVFPLYFYGLKYILPFLGFNWKGSVQGGGQSVDVFEEYLEGGKRELLDAILVYNQEDVRATAYLKDWLVGYAKERTRYRETYPWKK